MKSIKILTDLECLRFLSCIDGSVANMSDFERFALGCESLPLCVGSDFRRDFLKALSSDVGASITVELASGRENQKSLWRCMYSGEKLDLTFVKKDFNLLTSIDRTAPLSLNGLLSQKGLPENIEALIEQIDGDISLDISALKYSRPDEYHSALSFDKLKRGEECTSEDKCQILCWMLCRVLMKKPVRAYLIAKDNIETAKSIIALLEGRRIFNDLRLCVVTSADVACDVAEICLASEQKNISPEFIITEDIDVDNIKLTFAKFPASRIYLSSFLSDKTGEERYVSAFNSMLQEK